MPIIKTQLFKCVKLFRIDIQDRIKRLKYEPREEDRLNTERHRQSLTTDLILLQSMQATSNQSTTPVGDNNTNVDEDVFDNLDEDDEPDANADAGSDSTRVGQSHTDDITPPERKALHLPSHFPDGHSLCKSELSLRIKQASRYLAAIREAVAEKSFQYSHIIRAAPLKGVRTRSQGLILRISHRISYYSKVYCRARSAMIRLGASDEILSTFRVLNREDIKASTAILDPNKPGSSSIHLSWIWETGPRSQGSTPEAMRECKCRCRCRLTFGWC